MLTKILRPLGIGLCTWLLAGSAFVAAQEPAYPTKPVKVMIPYGPGSGIDVVVRLLNEALGKSMGQSFVAENRAGAAGTIAAAHVLAQGREPRLQGKRLGTREADLVEVVVHEGRRALHHQ